MYVSVYTSTIIVHYFYDHFMINLGHLSIFGGLYSVNSLVEVCQNLTLVRPTTVFFDQHVFVMFNYAATTAFLGFQAATIISVTMCT